ncbi:AAA family ATPase [Lentzea sp. CA-135723]|uniref:AAA family ATPase n=1 Tax=Lentzea sp. CA-135723 TaxID=3239950 RepID=UPI003D8D7D26
MVGSAHGGEKGERQMFVESVTLENFQCFGPRTRIELDRGLTAFIGSNGSGKTAACQALLRLFGVTKSERDVRADDFHVPVDECDRPSTRNLRIEAVLAFPELDDVQAVDASPSTRSVPEFFQRMAATDDGADLKVRIVLEAQWEDDNTIEGAVTDTRKVVRTFAEEYGEDEWVVFGPAERSRIQMIYIPAARDGAREVGVVSPRPVVASRPMVSGDSETRRRLLHGGRGGVRQGAGGRGGRDRIVEAMAGVARRGGFRRAVVPAARR